MKTIKVGNLELELTEERKARITSAMIETADKLEKELNYSEDLQHKDMVEFYTNHIEKLQNMVS